MGLLRFECCIRTGGRTTCSITLPVSPELRLCFFKCCIVMRNYVCLGRMETQPRMETPTCLPAPSQTESNLFAEQADRGDAAFEGEFEPKIRPLTTAAPPRGPLCGYEEERQP